MRSQVVAMLIAEVEGKNLVRARPGIRADSPG